MDQPARSALSALDALLFASAEEGQPRQPGEFTIEEESKRLGKNRQWLSRRFQALEDAGKMSKRFGIVGGRRTYLWRVK